MVFLQKAEAAGPLTPERIGKARATGKQPPLVWMFQNGLSKPFYTQTLSETIAEIAVQMGRECNPQAAKASAEVLISHPTAPTAACIDLFLTEFAKDPPKYLRDAKGVAKDLFWFGCDAIHNAFGTFMRFVLDAEKKAQREAMAAEQAARTAAYEAKLASDPEFAKAEEARIAGLINNLTETLEKATEAESQPATGTLGSNLAAALGIDRTKPKLPSIKDL